jgi:hypothetical protein
VYWKVALAQHPMYLLIKEDSQCAERTPPWGEPTIERYIERLRRSLAMISRYPRLRLGFEWSGVELELLADDAPDVLQEMSALAQAGRIAFYNGTYAQPHAQMLSSEANYRQLELGLRVYHELCHATVQTYCHQETSIHDQMPQLLSAFGIRYATLPWFYSTLAWLDEGELVIRGYGGGGPTFVHGHEFVRWCGLDGSETILYLSQTGLGATINEWAVKEVLPGLLHAPPIIVHAPDMLAIDDDWLARHDQVDFVLLDEALDERLTQSPPRARARFYANWSYVEGIRAEELSRCNWQAEASALQAEALNALAYVTLGRTPESTDTLWKSILRAQHHDAYCFGSVELRDKAVGWLRNADDDAMRFVSRAAKAVLEKVDTRHAPGLPVVVFNTTPHPHKALVIIDTPMGQPCLTAMDGTSIPSDATPLDNGGSRVRFLADMHGLGYDTYALSDGAPPPTEEVVTSSLSFENGFYRATVQPDGLFRSLIVKQCGDDLLSPTGAAGNHLAATNSAGLSGIHEESKSRWDWHMPEHGPERELKWMADAPMRARRSPLGVSLRVHGCLGTSTRGELEIMLYHDLQRIDVTWTFQFDVASLGLFYDDETKLRVQWPLSFTGRVAHDIAFGVIEANTDRPLLVASWLDASDGCKGLAYFHRGTLKHWVTNRTLINLFAWGEHTDAIGNRCKPLLWNKSFDQRLRGSHAIHCALYPHGGDWRAADLVGAARSYGAPPLAFLADRHSGELPPQLTILSFQDSHLAATSVRATRGQVLCRLYSIHTAAVAVDAPLHGMRRVALHSLAGRDIDTLSPFQIGELVLEREA